MRAGGSGVREGDGIMAAEIRGPRAMQAPQEAGKGKQTFSLEPREGTSPF